MGIAARVAARYKSKKTTDKGNVIYEYSTAQVQHRNREKAKRLEKLESNVTKLRTQVEKDLSAKDVKKRQTALAVGLIDHTFERVGNDESADEGHFGVTGWQKKHVTFSGGKATLQYIGKSGIEQEKTVTDQKLVTELKRAADACGDDSDCLLADVSAEDVNAYLKPYDVTAKDLRGFHANRVMREKLQTARKGQLPNDKKKREEKLKAEWKKALEATAKAVGHEPSTLGNQYLVPGLQDDFMRDGVVSEPGSKTAGVVKLDLAWVEKMRKDFLTLLKNIPHIKTFKEAHRVREGLRVYREQFDKLFHERFLRHTLKYDYEDYGISEDYAKYYTKQLGTPSWDFYIALAEMPIGFVDDYWDEDRLMARFTQEAPKWETRLKRKAQKFWKVLRDVLQDFKNREREIQVKTLDVEQVTLEGFRVQVRGFDPSDDIDVESLEVFKKGLRIYRRNAAARYPRLLKDQVPIVYDCEVNLDKGGTYSHSGLITFYASAVIKEPPARAAHILAHEMGHHEWRLLDGKAREFWETAIAGDYGDIDLAEVVAKWPRGAWAFDFTRYMADTDPVLALQMEGLVHSQNHEELNTKEDFQALLSSGQRTLRVPKTPITGYANKNPQEAFCEAVGLLVAYGPRALHERVRGWLGIILGNEVKVAARVAARYRAAFDGSTPFGPMDPDSVIKRATLAHRVARRFIADSYGDPKTYLDAMTEALRRYQMYRDLLPTMRKAERWVDQNPGVPPGTALTGDGELDKVLHNFRMFLVKYAYAVQAMYPTMWRAGGSKVFLALLQQYSFSDRRLRSRVEQGAKFYGKTRSRKPRPAQSVAVFDKAFTQYLEHLETIRDALKKGVPHGAEGAAQAKIPAGPFTLVNTGGFDDKTMDLVAKLAVKAAGLLKQHGYGRAVYGDIHISNTVGRSSKVLAFYSVNTDEMFVRANLKGKFDSALHTILHELGHRYEKFVAANDIRAIYRRLSNQTSDQRRSSDLKYPKEGETAVERGKTFVVSGTEYTGRGVRVNLRLQDDATKQFHTTIDGWYAMTGQVSPAGAFISKYARTDPSENFAEMVAHHCLGTLPQEQVELLEAII